MKERQRILISGKNWNDIIKLPCFDSLYRIYDGSLVLTLRVNFLNRIPVRNGLGVFTHLGETIVEYDNGKWEVIRKKEEMI